MINKDAKYVLILIVLGYFFFFFGNSLISLTSPDEVFYVQTAKEMAQHHEWMTPVLFNEPQFEKPIFIYWLLRISFLIFGVTGFSARFFPALFALIGVIAAYFLARVLFKDKKKAFISAFVLLSSSLYIGLARTVFTDMVFSVMILLSLLSFYWGYANEKYKGTGIMLFFISSALAVLAKGPLGLIIPLAVVIVFLFLKRRIKFILCGYALWGLIIFLAVSLPWYILMTAKYGQNFTHEFFYNDHYRRLIEAEHHGNDTWYFYPFTMLGCMFPWSIFIGAAFFYLLRRVKNIDTENLFLVSWIAVTLLIFQFGHSKLTSYIFPVFPALAMICGNFIHDSMIDKEKNRRFFVLSGLMWIISLLILAGIIFASFKYSSYLSSFKPVYILASILILWLAVSAFYILKKKSFAVSCGLAMFIPMLISIVPLVRSDIEPYFSSKDACEYFLKNCDAPPGAYLICSKGFARGTRFYTDMNVAVFAPDSGNYFSPHPIPFLDTDAKAGEFLRKQPLTYGFLKKSSLDDLKRVAGKEFEYQVVKNIGDQYIVKIQPK
jgi:4-amino-4-deoxy-L-arabinose transferase-like glycosyltransferase